MTDQPILGVTAKINTKSKRRSCLFIIAYSALISIASVIVRQYVLGLSAPITDIAAIATTLSVVGVASGFLAMYSTLPFTYPEQTKASIELMTIALSILVSLFSYCLIKAFVM